MTKDKLLIWGDAACDTGFSRVVHSLIEQLYTKYEISVLALNYDGDPHPIQQFCKLYNPRAKDANDFYGYARLYPLINEIQPNIVLFVNDPWVAARAVEFMPNLDNKPFRLFLYTAIDTDVLRPEFIKPLTVFDRIITYTEFGKNVLIQRGIDESHVRVIPHGVDTNLFYPMDKLELRKQFNLDPNWFIVQMVAQNQLRKRIDLGLYYFSEWVKDKSKDIKFFYHGPLSTPYGWDILGLVKEFDIERRFIHLQNKENGNVHGIPTEYMKYVYNVADVHMSTSMAEGLIY
jgi:glycosyltransferase involved in cell wall biosynthesis